MASNVEICNLALSLLGSDPITSLENPESKIEQLCALQYPLMRDAVLEEVEWSFAVRRYANDSPVVATPEWGYQYKFQIATDILRVTFCSDNSDELLYNPQFQWVVEDDFILCNSTQIYYRTINTIEDTTKFSTLFIQALAARLAMEMCIPLTENLKMYEGLVNMYAAKMQKAKTMDNMQGKSKRFRVGRLNNSRGGI